MDIKRGNLLIMSLKVLKCVKHPLIKLKKLFKKLRSRQLKIVIILSIIAVSIGITLLLLCSRTTCNLRFSRKTIEHLTTKTTTKKIIEGSPMRHVSFNEIYKNVKEDNDTFSMMSDHRQVNILDTPGCKIPIAMVKFKKHLKSNQSKILHYKNSCGRRALFLNKENGNKIRVYVDRVMMKQYLLYGDEYSCCFKAIGSYVATEDDNTKYSFCREIEHSGIYQLESDFVKVNCFQNDRENVTYKVYEDIYVFTKKIKIHELKEKPCDMKYNVLLIGMNSMSLPRVVQQMPRTVNFFRENFWLSFRGYHKIDDNTLPNLIALLKGQNMTSGNACQEKADKCSDSFIWNKFKKDGYATAFGNGLISMENTINRKLFAFNKKPIDHYLNQLYLTRTKKLRHKSTACCGKVTFGEQLLNYALDFVNTYKKHNFFGIFWMDSYTSDINSDLRDSDKMFENFFFKLSYTGSLTNTFVIFVSDQGIRYGDYRMSIESYYDERMPFLFMWVPTLFKGSYPQELRFLATNQFRLITPLDLYKTLINIKSISACGDSSTSFAKSGSVSQSILYLISKHRTCDDVNIHLKWCSCHNLYALQNQDGDGIKAVNAAISLINSSLKSIKTEINYYCLRLNVNQIIRMHFYYNKDEARIFYVVAFTVIPGEMSYEVTVSRQGDTLNVIGAISEISRYMNSGRCALKPKERMFCFCQRKLKLN